MPLWFVCSNTGLILLHGHLTFALTFTFEQNNIARRRCRCKPQPYPLQQSRLCRRSYVSNTLNLSWDSIYTLQQSSQTAIIENVTQSSPLNSPPPPSSFSCSKVLDMTDNSIFGDARYLSLSKEREIQGAYRNQCMDAPERRFQIRRNNKDDEGLVEIVVRQGNIGSVSDRKSSDEQATGVRVWNSAVSLLRILTLDPFLVENKAVVELGAGSGVVSIAAYHLGASQVIATDSNSEVLRLLQHNIKANLKLFNDAQENIQGVPLSWGVMGAAEFRDKYLASKAADVILGSDLTYNAGVFRQLLDTWTELADSDTQIIYVSARHDGFAAEVDAFRVLAEASGFGWEERTAWYRKQIPNFDETAKVIFLRLPKDKM